MGLLKIKSFPSYKLTWARICDKNPITVQQMLHTGQENVNSNETNKFCEINKYPKQPFRVKMQIFPE